MQGKWLLIIFGIILLVINAIATLISFDMTPVFLSFMPVNLAIYSIASGVLALLMIIVGISPHTF